MRTVLADDKIPELLGEILERHGDVCLVAGGFCMAPDILPGDTIVVRKVCTHSLRVGAIVLSGSPFGPPISHRIVGFTQLNDERRILLRADKLKAQVETVCEQDVIGKVISVRRSDDRPISMDSTTYTIKAFLRAKALLCAHHVRKMMVTLWMMVTRMF